MSEPAIAVTGTEETIVFSSIMLWNMRSIVFLVF